MTNKRRTLKVLHNLRIQRTNYWRRFYRDTWTATIEAIDELELLDQLEVSNNNLEINLEIFN